MNSTSPRTALAPLWLALHLPRLALEASAPLPSPSAVVEHGRILIADAAARQAGVAIGTGAAAARMLAPAITLLARKREREDAALHRLACWAGALTPKISLAQDCVLLDIGSCLRLFGGLEKIVSTAQAGVQAQGFSLAVAVAPAPLAAQWLAQTGTGALCLDERSLREHLAGLTIAVLPVKAAAALARFGARTLADARRLPGAALARRIGVETVHAMGRAFGEIPDPRPAFVFPEQFALTLQLPASVDNAGALLFAARRLSAALAGWLIARQAGVREMTLRLVHRHDETPLVLQFAELSADPGRFERVLRERLENLVLHAPVDSLHLEATQVAALAGRSQSLFADARSENEAIAPLLERLVARFGEKQVYRVALHADHRPECASRHASLFARPARALPAGVVPVRAVPQPLWLLARPEVLSEVDGRPCRQGRLRLLAGPERIEAGWWEGGEMHPEAQGKAIGDLRRDYFIALAADSSWLWIYRECRPPGGWYLHGFFS